VPITKAIAHSEIAIFFITFIVFLLTIQCIR